MLPSVLGKMSTHVFLLVLLFALCWIPSRRCLLTNESEFFNGVNFQKVSTCPSELNLKGAIHSWTPDEYGHSPFNMMNQSFQDHNFSRCRHFEMQCTADSVTFEISNCCPPGLLLVKPVDLGSVGNFSWQIDNLWYFREFPVAMVKGMLDHGDRGRNYGFLAISEYSTNYRPPYLSSCVMMNHFVVARKLRVSIGTTGIFLVVGLTFYVLFRITLDHFYSSEDV